MDTLALITLATALPASAVGGTSVWASSGVTISTTTETDIPGTSITFAVTHDALILAWGVFDVSCQTTGTGVFTGLLLVDGVAQTPQAPYGLGTLNSRGPAVQNWAPFVTAGTHTLKLGGALSAASGTASIHATHTTLTVFLVDI